MTSTSCRCSCATETSNISSPPKRSSPPVHGFVDGTRRPPTFSLPSFSAAKQWESLLVSTCSSRGISTPPSVMDPRWDSTVMQFGMRTRAARLGQRGSSCSSLQFRSSARSSRSNRGALPPLRSGGAPLPSRDHQRRPFPRGFRHRSVAYGRGRRPNPFFFE